MDVLVTGAHGTVGTAVTEHLADWGAPDPAPAAGTGPRGRPLDPDGDYAFTLSDRREPDPEGPHADRDHVHLDVTDRERVHEAVAGHDAVVHLAGYPTTDGSWDDVRENNVYGTHNVLEAAAEADVERVVFASSNHAVGMYELDRAPDIYHGTDLVVDADAPVRPDSEYGASKAAGEDFGRLYAERHGLAVYCLRIGSVRAPPYDHPFGDAERGVAAGRWERGSDAYDEQVARMRGTWQSRRDHAHQVDRCLTDRSQSFAILYGVSDNGRRWFDIGGARESVGYDPVDDGERWERPPEREG